MKAPNIIKSESGKNWVIFYVCLMVLLVVLSNFIPAFEPYSGVLFLIIVGLHLLINLIKSEHHSLKFKIIFPPVCLLVLFRKYYLGETALVIADKVLSVVMVFLVIMLLFKKVKSKDKGDEDEGQ